MATMQGETGPIDAALRRLQSAADLLEAAIAQSLEKARSARDRTSELVLLADDRTRLAEDLDASNARVASLANTNREVSRRIEQTMETIRLVLGTAER